jgi:hypothetical protein
VKARFEGDYHPLIKTSSGVSIALLPQMAEKLPCSKCGALILPATFQATGGVCMACKQGIRENIESSKAYYKQQREYDPIRELWSSLVKRVYKTTEGFAGLTAAEQLYYCVNVLEGELYNGGFHQFFTNSSGMYYEQVMDGLLELRAFDSLALLSEAKELLFGDRKIPQDQSRRYEAVLEYPETDAEHTPWCIRLEELNSLYWEDPDELGDRLSAYAEAQGLLEPFRHGPAA